MYGLHNEFQQLACRQTFNHVLSF